MTEEAPRYIQVGDWPNGVGLINALAVRSRVGLKRGRGFASHILNAWIAFGDKAGFTEKQWAVIKAIATDDKNLGPASAFPRTLRNRIETNKARRKTPADAAPAPLSFLGPS